MGAGRSNEGKGASNPDRTPDSERLPAVGGPSDPRGDGGTRLSECGPAPAGPAAGTTAEAATDSTIGPTVASLAGPRCTPRGSTVIRRPRPAASSVDEVAGVRVLRSAPDDGRPLILYLHGGGYVLGSPEVALAITERLAPVRGGGVGRLPAGARAPVPGRDRRRSGRAPGPGRPVAGPSHRGRRRLGRCRAGAVGQPRRPSAWSAGRGSRTGTAQPPCRRRSSSRARRRRV